MTRPRLLTHVAACMLMPVALASAADYPAPKEGDWVARDFRFHDGTVLPDVKLHYRTIGDPKGEPVLVLHGSSGSGESFLNAAFAGELFGAGQPLDASKYYIILADALGAGKSAKPSNGMRTKFPHYDYADQVVAQHRLVTEGLGIAHLRLVMGQSMGGMHSWQWAVMYPDAMDAALPMACQPTEMAGRNWMLRRILVEGIRRDPGYMDGNYQTQPASFKYLSDLFSTSFSGGQQGLFALASTHEKADKMARERLDAKLTTDANDFVYAYEASQDYNPAPDLEKIKAHVLAVNSADDERNPPELGILEREIKRVKNGSVYLIPGGDHTRGHGTTGMAKLWKTELVKLLQTAPHRTM